MPESKPQLWRTWNRCDCCDRDPDLISNDMGQCIEIRSGGPNIITLCQDCMRHIKDELLEELDLIEDAA